MLNETLTLKHDIVYHNDRLDKSLHSINLRNHEPLIKANLFGVSTEIIITNRCKRLLEFI